MARSLRQRVRERPGTRLSGIEERSSSLPQLGLKCNLLVNSPSVVVDRYVLWIPLLGVVVNKKTVGAALERLPHYGEQIIDCNAVVLPELILRPLVLIRVLHDFNPLHLTLANVYPDKDISRCAKAPASIVEAVVAQTCSPPYSPMLAKLK